MLTANDYLAARDADQMRPLQAALGLSVGCVVGNSSEADRRTAYRCDLAYTTAKEVAFDWLRDRVRYGDATSDLALDLGSAKQPPPILSGLSMAIIDEADAILLDEARTPLVLAVQQIDEDVVNARLALALARLLMPVRDFTLDANQRPELTPAGIEHCASSPALRGASGLWRHEAYRAEQVTLALVALHVLELNRDYVVHDNGVHIVDPNTGRMANGRRWSGGLHRLIELKENVACGISQRTLASITYQRFFPRYLRLSGTSGTLWTARAELAATYRVRVVPIPLQKPCLRTHLPCRLFDNDSLQAAAIVERTLELVQQGRPVLIGTASVAASERLSRVLKSAGVTHSVLNARQDADEAAIVAQAGQTGHVTVSTAMAGRGTDIALGPGVAERGGLAVILAAVGRSVRIDRQLIGRAGRHGSPGSIEPYVSLGDPLLVKNWGEAPIRLLRRVAPQQKGFPAWLATGMVRMAQWRETQRDRIERRLALDDDLARTRALSMTGATS